MQTFIYLCIYLFTQYLQVLLYYYSYRAAGFIQTEDIFWFDLGLALYLDIERTREFT